MTTWVLVANSSHARFLQAENLRVDELSFIKEILHPESRKKVSDLVTDRPGHCMSDAGMRGVFQKGNPKENEAEHFAITLAKELKAAHDQNKFQKLILVMPSHFQGLFAKHFKVDCDITHISKDYSQYTLPNLTICLREHLFVLP